MRYNKNQLNAYRGVLKNKNLAKVMEEGLTAPVGSTKRKRAQKMLSILKKTTIDGQGGPGPRSVPRVNVQLRPSTVDYSNLLILPPAPKIRVQFGEKAPTPKPVHDGQGYPGPMDGKGFMGFGGSTAPTAGSMTLNLAKSAPKAGGLVVPPYSAGLSTRLLGGLGAARAAGSALTGPIGMGLTAASIGIPAVGKNIVWGMQDRLVNHEADPMFRTSNSTVPYQEVLPKGQTATGNRAAAAAAAAANPAPITWGGKPIGGESTPTNTINGKSLKDLSIEWAGGVPGMSNFVDSGMPATDTPAPATALGGRFPGVQEAVDSNMGPTMFAYDSLKKEGGGLYERLMKIEETTRKSYGLDQMRDQLTSMVMSGNTLEGRLTDYIRGRDEFLNETEDVISDLKSKSMKMDMSDPRTRGNMQQHFNYLYEMRGRQNKRYVEFLDMSVNAYQGKIDAAKQVYDGEFARYENEVLNKQNIAKEEYNTLFTGLQEMYNTVAGAETAALEKQMMEYQLAAARAASIKDVIALEGVNSGDIQQLNKDLRALNVIGENGEWKINNNALSLSDANVYRLPELMDEGVARAMFRYDKDGNATPVAPDEALRVTQNALGHLMQLQGAGILVGEEYARREESIRNHLARYYESTQTFLPTESLPSYRKAIEALAGDGWIFNRKTPAREDFIKKYGPGGEGLDTGVLNTIYSNLEGYLQDGQTARSFVDTYFTDMGELAQPGEPIDSDSLMRRKMLQDYMQRLQPAKIAGTLSFNKVGGDTNPASLAKAAQAIANIESSGGNYRAVGPVTKSGDQAYGKYQVMGNNIPSWTKAALGVAMTPQQFLNNPQAQEAVFAHVFGGYVRQYGSYEDAASAWFSGRPMAKAGNASDVLGTSVPQYVSRFQQSFYG